MVEDDGKEGEEAWLVEHTKHALLDVEVVIPGSVFRQWVACTSMGKIYRDSMEKRARTLGGMRAQFRLRDLRWTNPDALAFIPTDASVSHHVLYVIGLGPLTT